MTWLIRALLCVSSIVCSPTDAGGGTNAVAAKVGLPEAVTTLTDDPQHPGDVIARVDPTGQTWRYTYDAAGDLVSASDPLSRTTTFTYDRVGRLRTVVSPAGAVAGATALSATTTILPNALGQPLSTTTGLGQTTLYRYDAAHNLASVTDPRGATTTDTYNLDNELRQVRRADGTTLRQTHDGDGNVVTQTNARGQTTTFAYDPLDRLTSATDPLSRTTRYGYDGASNVLTVTDALSHTTVYTYDQANQKTEVLRPDGTSMGTGYDLAGNVSSQTNALGQSTSYTYDAVDRVALAWGWADGAAPPRGQGLLDQAARHRRRLSLLRCVPLQEAPGHEQGALRRDTDHRHQPRGRSNPAAVYRVRRRGSAPGGAPRVRPPHCLHRLKHPVWGVPGYLTDTPRNRAVALGHFG